MQRTSLTSLFREFERYAKDVAVVQRRGYRRESWTYGKLAGVAFTCAGELSKRGIRTGERVLLWGPNSAEWMAAFWGCLLRGAVAVPIDEGATDGFVKCVMRETSAKLAIGARKKENCDVGVARLELEGLADSWARDGSTIERKGDVRICDYESFADEPLTRKHIAQIIFTSGTTAEPRGVVLTHGNFLANLEPLESGIGSYRKYEKWFHPLRFVTQVPLSHVFGQFMALFVPPLLGATIVFETSANPSEAIRTIKRERATALIAVPHMLDLLRGGIERDLEARGRREHFRRTFAVAKGRKFLRRAWTCRRIHSRFGWKFWAVISGGAALSSETEEFFKRIGYAVVQGYGMTETASMISLNHPFRATEGSVGKVLPGREFRLAEDGEILVRGESVSGSYWENGAQQTGLVEKSEWLKTGDIGEIDVEGNLRFRGRKKNVIVTPAGLNVYPEDLEAALRRQIGVRDCVVVASARGQNAEPCAVLLLSEPRAEQSAQKVVENANQELAEFQRMRRWLIWPEADFPRTPTAKPRVAAISVWANEQPGGGGKKTGGGSKGGEVAALIARFESAEKNSGELEQALGLSSLDRVELMSTLEEKFHVELDEASFARARTVADVERLLQRPGQPNGAYTYPRWTQRIGIRWIRLAVYYALVWPATQILGHPTIVGLENLADLRGPALIVSNHITRRADIGLILAALPGRFRHRLATAMGGETLRMMRHPPAEWFFARRWGYWLGYWLITALFNVFPLPQFSGFRESFRFAGESVDRGYSILVFPEGEVNNSEAEEMARFQKGIGLLAENLRIPVIPMRLDGVWKMKREGRRFAHRGEIVVRIGAPVRFVADISTDEITARLERIVRSL